MKRIKFAVGVTSAVFIGLIGLVAVWTGALCLGSVIYDRFGIYGAVVFIAAILSFFFGGMAFFDKNEPWNV